MKTDRSDQDLVLVENAHMRLAQNPSMRSLSSNINKKVFTGTGDNEYSKAHRTYLNEIGPGQYNLPELTGRHSLDTKRRNIPLISFSPRTKAPWHDEFHKDFVGQTSPPSTRYSPMLGKTSGEQSVSKLGIIGAEKKFREPTSVTNLRQSLPVQYSGINTPDSISNGFQ